jgi:hypothetical protein
LALFFSYLSLPLRTQRPNRKNLSTVTLSVSIVRVGEKTFQPLKKYVPRKIRQKHQLTG